MVEAAPQAQQKTTWNAQKGFVPVRVLLGFFFNVSIIFARFPFPCQKRFESLIDVSSRLRAGGK